LECVFTHFSARNANHVYKYSMCLQNVITLLSYGSYKRPVASRVYA